MGGGGGQASITKYYEGGGGKIFDFCITEYVDGPLVTMTELERIIDARKAWLSRAARRRSLNRQKG